MMNQVVWQSGSAWCSIRTLSGDILEVSWSPDGKPLPSSLFVLPQADGFPIYQDESTLLAGNISVHCHDEGMDFFSPGKKLLLRDDLRYFRRDDGFWRVEQRFRVSPQAALYGLGQYPGGVLDWRGHEVLLVQSNQGIAVPFLISTDGYAILWDSLALTRVSSKDDELVWETDCADGIRYYVIHGPDFDALIAAFRRLTGQAPLYPRWAYGYWQSKERYVDRDELLGTATRFRELGFPVDALIQDWKYWGDKPWSSMQWDPKVFPDPEGMIRELHDKHHLHLMTTIWPVIGEGCPAFAELKKAGVLFETEHWARGHIYDAFSAKGRSIYWKHVKSGLIDLGVDALWMDGTEPEFVSSHDPMDGVRACHAQRDTAQGSWKRVLNGYSMMTAKAVFDGQRAAESGKRVFTLSRSGFAGQQRYAAASWSGDIAATWKVLREQVAAGLNFAASGLPYWTTDIGGFFTTGYGARFPRGCADDAYRELYVRWYQFGAFCPLFRSHGTNTPREPWHFGGPGSWAYEALLAAARLRYRLMPYIYSQAWQITAHGGTLMRLLAFDFRSDPASYRIADQFMFGPALMVCPVLEPMFHEPGREAEPIPAEFLQTPDGESGLACEGFAGRDFEVRRFAKHASQINGNWAGGPPAGLPFADYSLRWEGELAIPESGEYEILLEGNDGRRLWLDGELVIDSWQNQGNSTQHLTRSFEKKSRHTLKVEYFHHSGAAALVLSWRRPGPPPKSERVPPQRKLYLPSGSRWYELASEVRHMGGQSLRVSTPISEIPVFVRGGSILPLGPEVEYDGQKPWEELDLVVYPGADARFTLYEDNGDGYQYENGEFSTIEFGWDDRRGMLSIADRAGSFPGLAAERIFRIRLAASPEVLTIPYSGQALVIALHRPKP
ncbi:TIM-barrel domain-containing protein [Niveibacterium terrae]|uniref:TIM-barrel domain-containing protein n=1 Tax=Niveibacterium terrae TaxID=3373598 RepID=UPI003A92477A